MYILVKRVDTVHQHTVTIIDMAELISALIAKQNSDINTIKDNIKMTILTEKIHNASNVTRYILVDDTCITYEIYDVHTVIREGIVLAAWVTL